VLNVILLFEILYLNINIYGIFSYRLERQLNEAAAFSNAKFRDNVCPREDY